MLARGTQLLILLTLFACLSKCGINPVPEPPTLQTINPPNTDAITLIPDPSMATDDVDILGEKGSVEPGAEVWAVNIDGTQPPVTTQAHADGSFTLTLQALPMNELRLQARMGARRSLPIDILTPAGPGPANPTIRPEGTACLLILPEFELILPLPTSSEPPSATIQIENDCASDITFQSIFLRIPSESFVITAPSKVSSGSSAFIEVQTFGSAAEELLLIQFESDRRPITLVSRGGAQGLQPACGILGGSCLSDPLDPTFAADCEVLGYQSMQATCPTNNTACCIAAP